MAGRRVASLIVTLGLVLGLAGVLSAPASAVTYGTAVTAPSQSVPWVVSLYFSYAAVDQPDFKCTATAISAREILTAAHCVEDGGFYFIRVGADRLSGGRLIPVEAVVEHGSYRQRLLGHDIALLRPLMSLGLREYAHLGSAALARKINGQRPPTMTLYGWGENQNERMTNQLRSAQLEPQGAAARRDFGHDFSPRLMLAAATLHKSTRRYTRACFGDSGGPLVVTVKGVHYVVGVTSWGSASCWEKSPSIFTSVGAYRPWLSSARTALPRQAATHNWAVPKLLTTPSVSGAPSIGSALSCNLGVWTENAARFLVTWHHTSLDQVGTGDTYVVTPDDAGQPLYCEVRAYSDAGGVTAAAAPLTVA